MRMKTFTPEEVIERLSVIGPERARLKGELSDNGDEMEEMICLGFELNVTAKQMVEALGNDPRTGKPVVGPARVFQIRDGK